MRRHKRVTKRMTDKGQQGWCAICHRIVNSTLNKVYLTLRCDECGHICSSIPKESQGEGTKSNR